MIEKIIIATHHGFCMGVKRAINIAEETAANSNEKVTILNEIVHNESVVNDFREKGVSQAFSVDDVHEGTLIISAHGVSPDVKEKAIARGLKVVDATCPLVEKIYQIVEKTVPAGYHMIHYGEKNHDETIGVQGHAPEHITIVSDEKELLALPDWKERKLGLTVQTTAHEEAYYEIEKLALKKWPHIDVFNTICNATSKRQAAILELSPKVDMVLVVGSESSANSNRLAQIANNICGHGYLIDTVDDINDEWFENGAEIKDIGISAGASTPEYLVQAVVEKLVAISGGKAEVILPVRKNRIRKISKAAG